jgi:hypothetical protein
MHDPTAVCWRPLPELTWPGMWRVRLPEGYLTDMVNLSRATDAADLLALAVLNRHREAA